MNCKDWEERVALHAGGDLAAADAAGVERHLAECAACRMLWSGIRQSLELLQGAHAEAAAPGIYTAVRGRVLGDLIAELAGRKVWWRRGWVVGLAAAVVLAVGLVSWPVRPVEPLPPPVLAVIPPAPPAQALRVLRGGRRQARGLPYYRRAAAAGPVEKTPPRPLMVRLVTDDPNVIIYWIAD